MKYTWIAALFLLASGTAAFADDVIPIEHITKWTGDSYTGSTAVLFTNEAGKISVQLETDDLILKSLTADQLQNYINLFSDPVAMKYYKNGQPWTQDSVEGIVEEWTRRWEQDQDPFSAFAIIRKSDNAFIGHIVLGHGVRYGQSEMAFLFTSESHNIWFATQAVTAVLNGYVPHLVEAGYPVNMNSTVVEPSPLRSIHATGHCDDTFSGQAMIRSGMSIGEEDNFWGAVRFHYLIRADEIMNKIVPPVDDMLYDTGD